MIRPLALLSMLLLAASTALADESKEPTAPEELIHVPIEEMDVLLKSGKKGIVVRYAEYKRLLEAARARRAALSAEPPLDGTLASADGVLEFWSDEAARLELTYDVRVVADGPRSIPFPIGGFGVERVSFTGGEGLFEERSGRPRLFFEAAGTRTVRVLASAQPSVKGTSRLLDLRMPPAGAMGLTVRIPAGYDALLKGEGPEIKVPAQARVHEVRVRPSRGGRLVLAMAPAAKGVEGPPILDTRTHGVHTIADGLIRSDVVVQTDVWRTGIRTLTLAVPADFAVHDLSGSAVTGFRRSDDRTRIAVDFSKPMWGRVDVKLNGEQPYAPGPGVVPPDVRVDGAIRHRATVALRVGDDVKLRGVAPTGGRRVAAGKKHPGVFMYALAGESAKLDVTLEPGETRTEAVSTYYLNLGEAGKTLLATTTYRVVDGTVFALRPVFPPGYELRDLTLNGQLQGFSRELRSDGTLEVRLARGVPAGGEIALAATLEQAGAEWLPDGPGVSIPLRVPSAGADLQEGLVAVGADATYRVLESTRADLVPVGANELTAQGVAAAGLLYGYRLDGAEPSLTLAVRRREPLLEADVVTALVPTPRRLEVSAMVVHRIDRAGVRRVYVDVPSWAGAEVRFIGNAIRAWHRLEGDAVPEDIPAGFTRWQVDLDRRVIGRHVMLVGYHADQDEQDWSIDVGRALCARVPLERAERMLVVKRADGLEVTTELPTSSDVRALDISELPVEATVDPLEVLEVVRLANGANGIGLAVKKHDGAAVLDAIATHVALATGVANEGVLRTRCHVTLVNVDRQFLGVTLPGDSELIGAVVNGKPVKPLVRGDGTILLPIPTARVEDSRVEAAMTYETRLGEELSGEVEIEGPTFENLEVLHTTHQVAFEPGLAIDRVEGTFTGRDLAVARVRKPLIAKFKLAGGSAAYDFDKRIPTLDASATTADEEAPLFGTESEEARYPYEGPSVNARPGVLGGGDGGDKKKLDRVETDNDLPYEESFGESEANRASRARPALEDGPPDAKPQPRKPAAASDPTSRPAPAPMSAGAASPVPDPPAVPGDSPDEDGERADGEGGISPHRGTAPRPIRAGGRRKGLLSLDVPVLLSDNTVWAHRLGSGGSMTITVSDPKSEEHGWLALLLLGVAAGLYVSRYGRGARWGAVLALGALALLTHLIVGAPAATAACAFLDAATILVGVHLLVKAGRFLVGSPKAATAAVLATFGLSVLASTAHADEPRPPMPKVKGDKKIYVPYDPSDKADPEGHDKVFLPLDTYLKLYKAAHPEADPDVVRLGRYVTVVDARYDLRARDTYAEGELTFELAKRGEGMKLVGLPVGGMAITAATLDDQPVRLLLDRGLYRVPLERMGRHRLVLNVRAPVVRMADRSRMAVKVPAFAGAHLRVFAGSFRGTLAVNSAGRVIQGAGDSAAGFRGEAWLGRTHDLRIDLVDRKPDTLPETITTRSTATTVFSLRDDGTEVDSTIRAVVLQGKAPFLDVDLAPGSTLMQVSGKAVVRWEALTATRVRVHLNRPTNGAVAMRVRAFIASSEPERGERLLTPSLVGATGESGRMIVNTDPAARIEVENAQGLYRAARPRGGNVRGTDGRGRILGAWTYAAKPAELAVRTSRAAPRIESRSTLAVVFGDDRVRSRLDALVDIDAARTPVGHLVFELPGVDDVRTVESTGLADWWTVGEGAERTLHLRYTEVRAGKLAVRVRLDRRLGGKTDGIAVPRWRLRGAGRDRGRLVLYSLPDVEPSAGSLPGLAPIALERAAPPPSFVPQSRAVHAFEWERPLDDSLIVVLRKPDLEVRAVTISQLAPSDEEHRLETLVLFDVRRGATDRLRIFAPDGGRARGNVIRAQDVREIREQTVTRKGADGADVRGTLYELALQSPRGGLIEVALSQVWRAGTAVRLPQPDEVQDRRWYSLVRSFVDGSVAARPTAGRVEEAVWDDLPFVPTGLSVTNVVEIHEAREPYVLEVVVERHGLEKQSAAVVLAATIDAVIGRDGYARIRASYRVFNRSRQFLRLKLPDDTWVYGASAASVPVKPLAGAGGTILLPVPKVPVGSAGYNVTIAYRARIGDSIDDGRALRLTFPDVPGVEVDRTVVRLFVPDGYRYDFDTGMTEVQEAAVAADLAEAALREARNLLKVTETGNVEQRRASAHNARRLIEEASRLSANIQVNKARPELAVQVKQAQDVCAVLCVKADEDFKAAQEQTISVNPSELEFGGNAAELLALQNEGPGQEQQAAPSNRVGWRFNNDAPKSGESGKKRNIQLKQQIEGELRGRGARRAQKRQAATEVAKQQAADQSKRKARNEKDLLRQLQEQHTTDTTTKDAQNEELQREVWRRYDAKNFQELNRRLQQSWVDNGQMGTANGLQNDDEVSGFGFTSHGQTEFADKDGDTFFTDRVPPFVDNGLPQIRFVPGTEQAGTAHYLWYTRNPRGKADELVGYTHLYNAHHRSGAALNPSSGVYFNDGTDGAFTGRTENIFDRPLGETTSAGFDGGGQGQRIQGKRGLMGVDVPLPTVGKVYYFRSLRAGSTIAIEADKDEASVLGRVVILLLVLGALGVLSVGAWRRYRMDRSAA